MSGYALGVLAVALGAACSLLADGRASVGRVVLVLQEGVEAEAMLGPEGPLGALPGGAAVALMNTAVRGPQRSASAYLTIGAGARADAGEGTAAIAFYRPDEQTPEGPAREVYRRRVGLAEAPLPPVEEFWLLLPALPSLGGPPPGAPLPPGTQARPGALAEAVRAWGGRTALLLVGARPPAADLPPHERLGGLVAMDARGIVARGAVAAPDAAADAARRLLRENDLLVIDLGRAGDLPALPQFLPRLAARLDPRRETLLAVVPAPLPRDGAWDRLTPVLAWGRGVRPGRLMSRTTRTPGLVANIDVAPTVARKLTPGGEGSPFAGSAMRVVPWQRDGGPGELLAFSRQVTLNYRAYRPVLMGAGLFAVFALGVVVAALLRPASWLRAAARGSLLAAAAMPAGFLIVPLLGPRTVAAYGAAAAASTLAVALLARAVAAVAARRGAALSPLLLLYLGTVLVLTTDLLLGGRAIAASLMSSFPLLGFRFYGIGNEYAGLLIGMAAVGLAGAVEQWAGLRRALPALFLLIAALIGLPGLGANFGEALTAVTAFAVTLYALSPRPAGRGSAVSPRDLLTLLGLLLLVAVALFAVDAARPAAERSHVGQLLERLLDRNSGQGVMLLAEVARRKLSMNLSLLTAPITLVVLAAVVPLLVLGYHRTRRSLGALLARRPGLPAGALGAAAGGAVGFLVNDSGVVVWGMATAASLAALLERVLADDAGDGAGRGRSADRGGAER